MNTELLLNIIQSVLTTVLIPLLGWGVSALVNFLNSKINNAKIEKYITFAGEVVESVAKETSQTYVNRLKESGKFDKEAQELAFKKSYDTALKLLTKDALEAIKLVYGDVSTWLTSKIEATVLENK